MAEVASSHRAAAGYLNQTLVDGEPEEFIRALVHVITARGAADLAKQAGLDKKEIFKLLEYREKPKHYVVVKTAKTLVTGLLAAAT